MGYKSFLDKQVIMPQNMRRMLNSASLYYQNNTSLPLVVEPDGYNSVLVVRL